MNVQSNCLFVLWLLLYLTKTSGNYNKPTSHLSWEKPKRLHFAQSWCNFNLLWQLTRLSWESCHPKLKSKNKKHPAASLQALLLDVPTQASGYKPNLWFLIFSSCSTQKNGLHHYKTVSHIMNHVFLICSLQLKEHWIGYFFQMGDIAEVCTKSTHFIDNSSPSCRAHKPKGWKLTELKLPAKIF